MYLSKDLSHEYLVTVFGQRRRSGIYRPADFSGFHISFGTYSQVQFSPACISIFQRMISQFSNTEILIFHNHPRNIVTDLLSQILDWDPLPSNTDRNTMSSFKYETIVHWLAAGHAFNVRFFLIENKRLREICLPSLEATLNIFKEIKI